MRIVHAGSNSLIARHVPWVYWLGVGLLLGGAYRTVPPEVDGLAELVEPLFLAAVALLVLLLWGQVVRVDIDRRRRRVVLKRWGLLGLRVRTLALDKVVAIYTERHRHEGNAGKLAQYRLVLLDGEQKLVALTPFSFMELGLEHTAEQMYDYLKESRGQPTTATYARMSPGVSPPPERPAR